MQTIAVYLFRLPIEQISSSSILWWLILYFSSSSHFIINYFVEFIVFHFISIFTTIFSSLSSILLQTLIISISFPCFHYYSYKLHLFIFSVVFKFPQNLKFILDSIWNSIIFDCIRISFRLENHFVSHNFEVKFYSVTLAICLFYDGYLFNTLRFSAVMDSGSFWRFFQVYLLCFCFWKDIHNCHFVFFWKIK